MQAVTGYPLILSSYKNKHNSMNILSRRQWLERISVPALATTVGASMIGTHATAADQQRPVSTEDPVAGARVYNVRAFGAKGDGKTLDTAAIQKAIDACALAKDGTVLIPAGDFLSGTLELKSNVTLHLSAGGKLLGSPRREDYTAGNGVPSGNGNIVFLYAVNATNLTIEGNGTVDGNGAAFYNGKGDNTSPTGKGVGGNFDRPHLFVFYQCTNLRMYDAFFTASAYHCCRILKCKHVHIDGIRIYNRVNRNNDGFHFNDGEYVHIVNCDVVCQDDACALFGSNKFVTVSNCTFSTRWSIFRFGGGASQDIAVTNCLIYDTYGCPIKISAGRARIENFTFSNIVMKNVTGPIGIGFSGENNNNNPNAPQDTEKPFMRNITFSNIRATVIPGPLRHSDIPFEVKPFDGELNSCITLNGMGEYYLENIRFTDVHVTYAGGGTAEQASKRDVPKVAAEYFGVWGTAPFGPPAYGLYARNVKGLTLQNVRFDFQNADLRPAVVLDNVQDASITGLSAQTSPDTESLVRMTGSKDILITASRALTPVKVFLKLEGAASEGIMIDGGDLRKAGKIIVAENSAQEKAVKVRA
jgi:polygalacturonase